MRDVGETPTTKNSLGIPRETEVSRPVYLEFLRFVKTERNLRRSDERHLEQSELTDETLYNRAAHPPKAVDEVVFDSLRDEHLRQAVAELPEIQRRRAEAKIKEKLKIFEN